MHTCWHWMFYVYWSVYTKTTSFLQITNKKRGTQTGPVTQRDIMSAIVQVRGPITTHNVVRRNWNSLRGISAQDFEGACHELETLGLGNLVNTSDKAGGHGKLVFIKKDPDEIGDALEGNSDLCFLEIYRHRYHQSPSKTISLVLKAKLVSQKLLPEKVLKWWTRNFVLAFWCWCYEVCQNIFQIKIISKNHL